MHERVLLTIQVEVIRDAGHIDPVGVYVSEAINQGKGYDVVEDSMVVHEKHLPD